MKGLSLIEILITISIVAIIGAMASPFLSNYIQETNLSSSTVQIKSLILKAQSNSMDGRNNATWGICKLGSTIRMYAGTCNSPTVSENYTLPTGITVNNFTDFTFNQRGEPTVAQTITVSSSLSLSNLTINLAGSL